MIKAWSLIVMSFILVFGCSSAKLDLSDKGRNVKLAKADPPNRCKEIGHVDSEYGDAWAGGHPPTQEQAHNTIRNNAGEKGANYVRMETVERLSGGQYKIDGTAYRCPASK